MGKILGRIEFCEVFLRRKIESNIFSTVLMAKYLILNAQNWYFKGAFLTLFVKISC
ncbi:hypothetical protein [uncultured Gammaproteobacteria bacterium]|nr:hypothetical protein [uncultured Gammaproteobacteria bacterium]